MEWAAGNNLPALYRRQVERVEAALNEPLVRDEGAEVLRELIEKVVLLRRACGHPRRQAGGRGLDAARDAERRLLRDL